jgi:hypothetical protein
MDMSVAVGHAVAGRRKQAEAALAQLEASAKARYVPATYMGILCAALGEKDRAFEWLERAVEERADGLTLLNVDPMVDEIRSDPRFQRLLGKVGLLLSPAS